MKNQVQRYFSDFFQKWISQLEELVLQLLKESKERVKSDADLRALVFKVTTHYKEYYSVKWAQAGEDVLAFFSPPWLSPLENAYSWVTGWKPGMAFRLVESIRKIRVAGFLSLADISEEQAKKIEELEEEVRREEEKVEREIERQQVAVADRRMLELAQMTSGGMSKEVEGLVEASLKVLLGRMETTMRAADCVRLKTLKELLEVLNPLQCVDFLAAIFMLQIQLRNSGWKRVAC